MRPIVCTMNDVKDPELSYQRIQVALRPKGIGPLAALAETGLSSTYQ
jgi:hypothetical protein